MTDRPDNIEIPARGRPKKNNCGQKDISYNQSILYEDMQERDYLNGYSDTKYEEENLNVLRNSHFEENVNNYYSSDMDAPKPYYLQNKDKIFQSHFDFKKIPGNFTPVNDINSECFEGGNGYASLNSKPFENVNGVCGNERVFSESNEITDPRQYSETRYFKSNLNDGNGFGEKNVFGEEGERYTGPAMYNKNKQYRPDNINNGYMNNARQSNASLNSSYPSSSYSRNTYPVSSNAGGNYPAGYQLSNMNCPNTELQYQNAPCSQSNIQTHNGQGLSPQQMPNLAPTNWLTRKKRKNHPLLWQYMTTNNYALPPSELSSVEFVQNQKMFIGTMKRAKSSNKLYNYPMADNYLKTEGNTGNNIASQNLSLYDNVLDSKNIVNNTILPLYLNSTQTFYDSKASFLEFEKIGSSFLSKSSQLDFTNVTVQQLKILMKEFGLTHTGKKNELIDRVKQTIEVIEEKMKQKSIRNVGSKNDGLARNGALSSGLSKGKSTDKKENTEKGKSVDESEMQGYDWLFF